MAMKQSLILAQVQEYAAVSWQIEGHLNCVDVSSRWLLEARHTLRRYTNVSYFQGAIWDVDVPDNSHQGIFVHFTLHDIPENDQEKVFQCLCSKLKTKGKFFLRETASHGSFSPEIARQLANSNGLAEISFRNYRTWHSGKVTEFIWQK
jgi:ubiquinone/menaquinone biosynthesis C-methylase UbiE